MVVDTDAKENVDNRMPDPMAMLFAANQETKIGIPTYSNQETKIGYAYPAGWLPISNRP